jgi:hypothetical protein
MLSASIISSVIAYYMISLVLNEEVYLVLRENFAMAIFVSCITLLFMLLSFIFGYKTYFLFRRIQKGKNL